MITAHWDVDTQVDFIDPAGKLHVPGAERLRGNLAKLTRDAHRKGRRIIASADSHRATDVELSDDPDFKTTFPPHCIEGTPGQTRIAETRLAAPLVIEPDADAGDVMRKVADHPGDILFNKRFFDVFTNPHVNPTLELLGVDEVVLYGVALDVCNRYAVEGLLAHQPGIGITVVVDAVQAIDEREGAKALAAWLLQGVRIKSTAQVCESEE